MQQWSAVLGVALLQSPIATLTRCSPTSNDVLEKRVFNVVLQWWSLPNMVWSHSSVMFHTSMPDLLNCKKKFPWNSLDHCCNSLGAISGRMNLSRPALQMWARFLSNASEGRTSPKISGIHNFSASIWGCWFSFTEAVLDLLHERVSLVAGMPDLWPRGTGFDSQLFKAFKANQTFHASKIYKHILASAVSWRSAPVVGIWSCWWVLRYTLNCNFTPHEIYEDWLRSLSNAFWFYSLFTAT
jgi:hypothetical protein